MRARRYSFPAAPFPKHTHYLFRYPAKFHPPIARSLLKDFTASGSTVLDPFCGSGTVSVEAAVSHRASLGIDIDPVAVLAARAKTQVIDPTRLRTLEHRLLERLRPFERSSAAYDRFRHSDISGPWMNTVVRREELVVPPIPNIEHWFRKYVIVDLARILAGLKQLRMARPERDFFLLCFASIIRISSNADPVPVSGLEVTAHMRRRLSAGHRVNPYSLFRSALTRAISAMERYVDSNPNSTHEFFCSDATAPYPAFGRNPSAIITSPPYQSAVDYYRRHTLEMYWLGFVRSSEQRLRLLPKYIGRATVPKSHPLMAEPLPDMSNIRRVHRSLQASSESRARAFHHYCCAMHKSFECMATALAHGAPAIIVVGNSRSSGGTLPTASLILDLASPWFVLRDRFWYPLRDRYMSYARHNGADINKEFVLVLERQ